MIWQSETGISSIMSWTPPRESATSRWRARTRTPSPFAERAVTALSPWRLEELYREFDGETSPVERGGSLCASAWQPPPSRRGMPSPDRGLLGDEDPRIRLAGLWAVTYTGYEEFLGPVRRMAREDTEPWIRTRAESIVAAFAGAGDGE
ncbi:HEAT repeat domain-containing protein [Streptomyces nogalater]